MSLNAQPHRIDRGRRAHVRGVEAEAAAADALVTDGWTIQARRLRNAAGEIDIVAERDGVMAVVEVKARASLGMAAMALRPFQQARIAACAGVLLGEHPEWGRNGVRFDVMLVDDAGRVRRIADAFRLG